jgi:hypothetical protein
MKKLKIIFATILISLAFSCAKDDEVPPSLLGKWEIQKWNKFDNGNLEADEQPFFSQPGCKKASFELKSNNIATKTTFSGANCGIAVSDESYISDGMTFQANFILPDMYGKIVTLTNSELIFDILPSIYMSNTEKDYRLYRITCSRFL